MKKHIEEFKKFAMRGNVVDLAVGIVIGGAFGKVVSSLVSDVLMPPIGVMLGGVDFSKLSLTIQKAVMENGEIVKEAIALNYGSFIQTIVDFVIIAFAIFMIVKAMNKMQKKEEEKSKEPPKEEKLLTEIRDILKEKVG
ncbi:MAG: large-conductance mechanosensitive channel protein MscL [Patescibacteria group bacterium]|nr:large-conductance mechanosensitive channel protein MscL [Patescibacteria group bacterium]